MLFDILGIALGFALVMLLLSFVVTMLVQMTQHVVSLRYRNLQTGLNELLPLAETKLAQAGIVLKDVRLATILESQLILPKTGVLGERGCLTWLYWKDLERVIRDLAPDPVPAGLDAAVEQIQVAFDRMEKRLAELFGYYARLVAIVWAVVVAFLFQVNAVDVLHQFASKPELRQQAAIMAQRWLDQEGKTPPSDGQTTQADSTDPVDLSLAWADRSFLRVAAERALPELSKRYSDVATTLEAAGGTGTDMDALLNEMDLVVKDLPEAKARAIKIDYETLLRDYRNQQMQATLSRAGMAAQDLGSLGFALWGKGTPFYWQRGDASGPVWSNILGVLLTAGLISLGAPFWFKALKDLVSLRSAFQTTRVEQEAKKQA